MSAPARSGRGGTLALVAVALAALLGAAALAVPLLREAAAADGAEPPPASTAAAPQADAPAQAPLFVAFDGDPVAGQRVVMGASGAGVGAACFHCHGLQGGGDGGGGFPRLAGQPAYYLYKQLGDYANGKRPNDIMTPIAVKLTERERRDVAAYYAAAESRTPGGGGVHQRFDGEQVQRGGSIAALGAPARGVQSCVGCHGPAGSGLPPDVPYLAGLAPHYIELQLRLWAEGRRTNDVLGQMADIARRLSPQDRNAVAQYFGSLPPP